MLGRDAPTALRDKSSPAEPAGELFLMTGYEGPATRHSLSN